jgi:hypothetical protein
VLESTALAATFVPWDAEAVAVKPVNCKAADVLATDPLVAESPGPLLLHAGTAASARMGAAQ